MSVPFNARPGSLSKANDNDLSDHDDDEAGGIGFDFAKREEELRQARMLDPLPFARC
jgi:hypothetical protein